VTAWCSGQHIVLDQRSFFTLGTVTTWIGDCLLTGQPESRCSSGTDQGWKVASKKT